MDTSWTDHAQRQLADAGFRRGGARRAVIEVLDGEECAVSAVEIEDALRAGGKRAGRASIYRVLDELDGLGLVTRVETGEGMSRYETASPDSKDHHHHLVCDTCGRLVPFHDAGLERAISKIARRAAFSVDDHDVTLRGRCEACGPSTKGS